MGDPADRRTQAALRRRGYDTDHEARQFRAEWFDDDQLVVAMDRDNLRDLRRLAPTRMHADNIRLMLEFDPDAESLDVPDPYYGASTDFDSVLSQIERRVTVWCTPTGDRRQTSLLRPNGVQTARYGRGMDENALLEPLDETWNRALVVVAHPDDMEYGGAAATSRWVKQGKQVAYCLITSGEAGIDGIAPEECAPLREAEQRAACAAVGVTDVEFLGFPDGMLEYGFPFATPSPRASGVTALTS